MIWTLQQRYFRAVLVGMWMLIWAGMLCALDVPQFGIFEQAFTHSYTYANPYKEINASASFISPAGKTFFIPLFWDGGASWKVRFSPEEQGNWNWSVESSDPGLDSQHGTFECKSSNHKGGILVQEDFPYHFKYQDGTLIWLFGDTLWRAFGSDTSESLDRATLEHYIDIRASQGFNYIHANLLSSGYNEGGPAFTRYDKEEINPEFWQEVDERIAYFNQNGITVMMILAWANGTPSWTSFPDNTARLRYVRYVVARYSGYNVCFNVSGEWNETGSKKMYRAIGSEIANTDPHSRMITIHSTGSVEKFAIEPWMSFGDYQQLYRDLHKRVLKARDHEKPVVNCEYAYYLRDRNGDGVVDKPNSATLREIRYATWDIVMAGGYFVTGWGTTYNGGSRDLGPFNPDDPRNDDWEEDVQHIRTLFTGLEWWKLQPNDSLVSGSGIHYCLAEPGHQYLVYTRGKVGTKLLSLDTSKSGIYTIKRFNPRDGSYTTILKYSGKGPLALNPPNKLDWVFVIKVKDNKTKESIRQQRFP